jgi:hypothetical protein
VPAGGIDLFLSLADPDGKERDALTPILIAGRFRFVLVRGTRFLHRSARLNSLRLETKLTEDDWTTGCAAGNPVGARRVRATRRP